MSKPARGLAFLFLLLAAGTHSLWAPLSAASAAGAEEQASYDEESRSEEASALLRRVNRYLEAIRHLEGAFLQVNADGSEAEGIFYIRRPWRMRFQYSHPNDFLVVADGTWLVVQEDPQRPLDRYPLSATPLQFLLAPKPNLEKAARLLRADEKDSLIRLSLKSRLKDAPGMVELHFHKKPFALASWVITDPQGLRTRVVLKNVKAGRKARNNLFQLLDKTSPSRRMQR